MSDPTTPLPPEDNEAHLMDLSSDLQDIGVSKDLQALLNRGLIGKNLPRQLRSRRASEAFQQAFDLIGGVPRLALWADRNPDKFFQLYGRLMALPPPPQGAGVTREEMAWVSARRLMYQMGATLAEDIESTRKDPDSNVDS